MTKKQNYFLRQKLVGLIAVIFAVILTPISIGYEMAVGPLLLAAVGLLLMTSKKMLIVDDYYYEVKERRRS